MTEQWECIDWQYPLICFVEGHSRWSEGQGIFSAVVEMESRIQAVRKDLVRNYSLGFLFMAAWLELIKRVDL